MKQFLTTILAFIAVFLLYWPGNEQMRATRVRYRNAAKTRIGRRGRLFSGFGAVIGIASGALLPIRQALSWPRWSFNLLFVLTMAGAVVAVFGGCMVGYSDGQQRLARSRSAHEKKTAGSDVPTA